MLPAASVDDDDVDEASGDICRVCRMGAAQDRPLFYPCLCTGSIKYIHQECLVQWLKYSKKEYCELCNFKYSFTPIYHPDMPKRLPIRDVVAGLLKTVGQAIRYWLHYTLVAMAWLGAVPLSACRIYRCLFTGSVHSLLTLPFDMLSTEHLVTDCVQGALILAVTLCAFISLVWLREQIIHGGVPPWMDDLNQPIVDVPVAVQPEVGQADEPAPNIVAAAVEPQAFIFQDAVAVGHVEEVAEAEAALADVAEQEPAPDVEPLIGGEVPAVGNVNEPAEAANPEAQWHPFEWQQGGDDLTWERLLGLDGSLVFLEHVFWVISLNALFMIAFAFAPYHIGRTVVALLGVRSLVRATYFEGVATTLLGYIAIGFGILLLYEFFRYISYKKTYKFLGMSYLVIKVFLLCFTEIGLFPIACGWWLDICTLGLFSASITDRITAFHTSPGTSTFVHWLVGMVFVFYFASLVLLLREVLRPGVLWFLRNLNDPDFNPITEMLQYPVFRHLRRFVASSILFGALIGLFSFVPLQLVSLTVPSVLPYHITLNIEAPLSELSLELLLLQVVLPTLLEQGHARNVFKTLVKYWCVLVGECLGLTSYLLPATALPERVQPVVIEEPQNNAALPQPPQAAAPDQNQNNLANAHLAMMAEQHPTEDQPYAKKPYFAARITLLVFIVALTSVLVSVICLTVPVTVGRTAIYIVTGRAYSHELYTIACGLYLSWLALRGIIAGVEWMPQGWLPLWHAVKTWGALLTKCLLAAVPLILFIPLMMGLLFQLVVITPLRVYLTQSPLYFPWQDWAMGILHMKIACAALMMGPDWWLKQACERVYRDGLRNLNLTQLYTNLVIPVVMRLGLLLAVPYVLAHSVVPLYGGDLETEVLFQRHVYPSMVVFTLVVSFLVWQVKQFQKLVVHIRNDKYLMGQRLVNYDRRPEIQDASALVNG